jgi:UDP-2,3-diacylglucosamine hydrolase
MIALGERVPAGKKIFFASDFHLGTPSYEASRQREEKIVQWLNAIESQAHAIFLVGDIFDFWFEYRKAIPKGFIRFQGKLAELTDKGIPVYFFSGNHDMWMFEYFKKELGIPVFHDPKVLHIHDKKLYIGHGDGLGPGDKFYKVLKRIFRSKLCQWGFRLLHPDLGISIAHAWSQDSRSRNTKKGEDEFQGENEWLYQYCQQMEQQQHHDLYIFGHRHLPLDLKVNEKSRYINLGEWLHYFTYGEFDGENFRLLEYGKEEQWYREKESPAFQRQEND